MSQNTRCTTRGIPRRLARMPYVLVASMLLTTGACAKGSVAPNEGAAGAGGSGAASSGSGGAGGGGVQSGCSGSVQDADEVFAHSADTLYRVDPKTLELFTVARFACPIVIDIAVDKDGALFGTTSEDFVAIDKKTADCTVIKSGQYPNSLSFVPEGTLYPDREALVGYVDDRYVTIDRTTGAVEMVGELGGGYRSSGDIVSVVGGSTYLTVNGNECNDCLVRIDPKTGKLLENLGPIGAEAVFGLAYWDGLIYGFTGNGRRITFNETTKVSTLINLPSKEAPPLFFGAGSSTCAPLPIIR